MEEEQLSQALIQIEEEHTYNVDLGAIPFVEWQQASGKIQARIPYDGSILRLERAGEPEIQIGEVVLRRPLDDERDTLPLRLAAGVNWDNYLKSSKIAICEATYPITEPGDTLLSIEGLVLDDAWGDNSPSLSEGIFGDIDAFKNPLALSLALWVPDLLAQVRPSQAYELETMLLRRENTRQAFIPSGTQDDSQQIAQSLAALANTLGGTILIGADRQGNVIGVPEDSAAHHTIAGALLGAILHCTPPVPVTRVAYVRHTSGKTLVRVDVPGNSMVGYRVDGVYYRRQGADIAAEAGPTTTQVNATTAQSLPEFDVENVFGRDETGGLHFRSRDDVIVLNGNDGLRQLRIGAYLCGLINAGKRAGRIVITNLSQGRERGLRHMFATPVILDDILQTEMEKLQPHFPAPQIERRQLGNQQIAVINVPYAIYPVALYDGAAYVWHNLSLNEARLPDLLDKYIDLAGISTTSFDDQDVYLDQASISWPVRPPERLERDRGAETEERIAYDVQHQSLVWEPRPFKPDDDTVGFTRQLKVPLRHVSLTLDDNGNIATEQPIAKLNLRVRINGVLVSGLEVTPVAAAGHSWVNTIPLVKRTYLNIQVTAHLNELFKRRAKNSLMRFLVSDVLLDAERLADLAQVCADSGFRVYESNLYEPAALVSKATIRGMRSQGYFDIFLLAGFVCEREAMQRELQYDNWRDNKAANTSLLDVRIALWGTGSGVEAEIARLQMHLYRTINQRLQHLRNQ